MLTVDYLTQKAQNLRSPAREWAERAGWTFEHVEVLYDPFHDSFTIRVIFVCVCGKHERFANMLPAECLRLSPIAEYEFLDFAAALQRHGSFSREHLREDGYSEADIDAIYARGRPLPC